MLRNGLFLMISSQMGAGLFSFFYFVKLCGQCIICDLHFFNKDHTFCYMFATKPISNPRIVFLSKPYLFVSEKEMFFFAFIDNIHRSSDTFSRALFRVSFKF